MRKDIFVVGTRLLGIWQLVGAVMSLAYMIFYWIGYFPGQPANREYSLIRFGIELLLGLILSLRPYTLYSLFERMGEEDQEIAESEEDQK